MFQNDKIYKKYEEWLEELEKYKFYIDEIKPDLDALDFAIGETQGMPDKVKIISSLVNLILPDYAKKYSYIKTMTDLYDGDIPICESVLITEYDLYKNGELLKRNEEGYGVD